MSTSKTSQPKVTPRRSKGGSIVSQTYQFPYKPAEKSLGQLIYDSEQGKVLGRTPRNWGKINFGIIKDYHIVCIPISNSFARLMR